MATENPEQFYAGLDLGTSGCRLTIITADDNSDSRHSAKLVYEDCLDWPEPTRRTHSCITHCTQDPAIWWEAVNLMLEKLANKPDISLNIKALLVDGTSSTVLATDGAGSPLEEALMYADNSGTIPAELIDHHSPDNSPARGPGSSLAKWIYFTQKYKTYARNDDNALQKKKNRILHQADWIIGKLCHHYQYSDEHNCLKLGYDSIQQCWPHWVIELLNNIMPAITSHRTSRSMSNHDLLPIIKPPGDFIGFISKPLTKRFNLNPKLKILAGTTDSTASLIASGANIAGDAVTSLGSTLVLKILSPHPIFDSNTGIYSHQMNNMWLVGGASNTGGAALKQFFTQEEINKMTPLLNPEASTGLNYYPLPGIGERFPVADTSKTSNTQPRPDNDSLFFQGLLEGITAIEKQGYDKLRELGAPQLNKVITTGGGAKNEPWRKIRERMLGIPVTIASHQQAAYGAALLAMTSSKNRGSR